MIDANLGHATQEVDDVLGGALMAKESSTPSQQDQEQKAASTSAPRKRRKRLKPYEIAGRTIPAELFNLGACRTESTRRFKALQASYEALPTFEKVRSGRALIRDLPRVYERQTNPLH